MIITQEEVRRKGISKLVEEHKVQFFDFGCSEGGSLDYVKSKLSRHINGMGFDIDPSKLETASSRNHIVTNFDILELPQQRLVNFTILFHVLEHLDSNLMVKRFVHKACALSREFVFLKQPFFDADPYLFARRLKLYWSDWHGHPNRMTSLELYLLLADLYERTSIAGFTIYGKERIVDSACNKVLPLEAPMDQHDYHPDKHPPKKLDLVFDIPVFYELAALIEIQKGAGGEIIVPFKPDVTLFSTS